MRLVKQAPDLFLNYNILDVGAGSGTYSDRYSSTWLPRSQFHWTGLEIWEPYVEKFDLNEKYDEVQVVDAVQFAMDTNRKFEIAFVGDVLEHIEVQSAKSLIEHLLGFTLMVVISIPLGHYPQGEFEGNPYEKHVKDDWTHEEVMAAFPNVVAYCFDGEIGVYVCSRHVMIEQILRPQIGVYTICKNEKNFIERMWRSVEQADFVTICDTGSTDGTWELLTELVDRRVVEWGHEKDEKYQFDGDKKIGASDGVLTVKQISVDPWRFDDAKNVALMLLPEEIDVAISLDADEEMLDPNWHELLSARIKQGFEGPFYDRYHHRFQTIWDWEGDGNNISDHWHERIHARHGYVWKLPVHEVLVKRSPGGEGVTWMDDLHMQQRPDTSKPRSSYLPLLEQSLMEDPRIWKSWCFYAQELANAGRLDDAINALKSAQGLEGADQAYLYRSLADYYRLQKNYRYAIASMGMATQTASHVREYKVYLAQLYHEMERPNEARRTIGEAREIQQRTFGYEYDPNCWGEAFEALAKKLEQ